MFEDMNDLIKFIVIMALFGIPALAYLIQAIKGGNSKKGDE